MAKINVYFYARVKGGKKERVRVAIKPRGILRKSRHYVPLEVTDYAGLEEIRQALINGGYFSKGEVIGVSPHRMRGTGPLRDGDRFDVVPYDKTASDFEVL